MTNTIPSDGPKAIAADFLTHVDFGKFWEHFLGLPPKAGFQPKAGDSLLVTHEKLEAARQTMLDAGVPTRTVMHYFIELGSMVDPDQLGMVEEIQYELQDVA